MGISANGEECDVAQQTERRGIGAVPRRHGMAGVLVFVAVVMAGLQVGVYVT